MAYVLESEVREYLTTLQTTVPDGKDAVRAVLLQKKRENVIAARPQLKRLESKCLSLMRRVDYTRIRPKLAHVAPKDKPLWEWCRQIVSSTPWGGRVGRMSYLWCVDQLTGGVLGIVEICSDMLVLGPRDKYIGWTHAVRCGGRRINNVANVGTCVCVAPFGSLCGGKFQITAAASSVVADLWEHRYGDRLAALCTTSLYGESSIYNRLKEWKYLGDTEGLGIFHLTEVGYKLLQAFLRENRLTARTGSTSIDPGSRHDVLNKVCNVLRVDRETVSSHQPRGVYVSELVPDACRFLRGEVSECSPCTRSQEEVSQWWVDRWYSMRLPKKLDEIKAFDWSTYRVDSQIELCGQSAISGTVGYQPAGV